MPQSKVKSVTKKSTKKKSKSNFVSPVGLKLEFPKKFDLNASTVSIRINDHNYLLIRSMI